MAGRIVRAQFDTFTQARLAFVRSIADLSERPEYLEALLSEDAFEALKPMLHDKVATVQQTAALALGRMAGCSIEVAIELVKAGILGVLNSSMDEGSPGHMKAGAFVIKQVAKHSEEMCTCCIEAECCATLTRCLMQLDVTVREAAAHALATIAMHSGAQAAAVASAGCVPLLATSLAEPEPALKRACALALGEIAKHDNALASAVAAAGALPTLAKMIRHAEAKVRRQACATLSHIIKHTAALAEDGAAAGLFPQLLVCMQDADPAVRKAAATAVRETVKHSEALARVVAGVGGISSLIEYISTGSRGPDRLSGFMALGFVASFAESLAQAVIDAGGAQALRDALVDDMAGAEDYVMAAVVWAVGQVGKHSPAHARAVAKLDALRHIQALHLSDASSADLIDKTKRCLKAVLAQCDYVPAMQSLLPTAPPSVAVTALRRLAEVLRASTDQRREFLASGGLKMVQTLDGDAADGEVGALIEEVNNAYPAEVVAYCRPSGTAFLGGGAGQRLSA